MKVKMKGLLLIASLACHLSTNAQEYQLVWSDEFDGNGVLDENKWTYEEGFVRNHEDQWYQKENAYRQNGMLVIECDKLDTLRLNPWYDENSDAWNRRRKHIRYTSACVTTKDRFSFTYGRMEVKARIPVAYGAWPAIWTLGNQREWPSCGEIDVMEYYRIDNVSHVLANVAWGNDKRWDAVWNSVKTPYQHFLDKDSFWHSSFHVWRLDWDKDAIRIYLDDELLNETPVKSTVNGSIGDHVSPFNFPQYILLNLALGGDNGGRIDDNAFPMRYEIDYVRVWQRK